MVDRGLLFKEWKQHQAMLLIISIITVISYPLNILSEYAKYRVCLRNQSDGFNMTCGFILDGTPLHMYFVAGIIIAIIQIGIERNKGIMDFTLGLPFTRKTIFRSKAFIGTLVIWGSQMLSFIFSLCLIGILRPDIENFYTGYLWSTLTCFMLYMLMLAAGTMTGSVVAQLMVGFTASILPMLVFVLIVAHIDMLIGGNAISFIFTLVAHLTPLAYVNTEVIVNPVFVVPLMLTILFYWIGLVCFEKLPNEREGYFFLSEKMNKPIQLLVIIFGIFGVGLFGNITSQSFFGYLVGMVIGGVIGFLLSYFLIFKKSKI
ncbi:hypothetical protein ABES25_20155 [Bacillus gobiensis]|uniref:hypothetical protein n=1 Tax=Bacillus gobiensis TaxID=1441095 RepID=UPI003D1A2AE8